MKKHNTVAVTLLNVQTNKPKLAGKTPVVYTVTDAITGKLLHRTANAKYLEATLARKYKQVPVIKLA